MQYNYIFIIFNLCWLISITITYFRIGFAIAKRLGEEGASVVISSRKKSNVKLAVEKLKKQGVDVEGFVCHVGNVNDRNHLFQKVYWIHYFLYLTFTACTNLFLGKRSIWWT